MIILFLILLPLVIYFGFFEMLIKALFYALFFSVCLYVEITWALLKGVVWLLRWSARLLFLRLPLLLR